MKTRLIAWEIFCAFIRYEVFKNLHFWNPSQPSRMLPYAYLYGGAKFVSSAQLRLFVLTCKFELIPFRRKLCRVFFLKRKQSVVPQGWLRCSQRCPTCSWCEPVHTIALYPLYLERNLISLFNPLNAELNPFCHLRALLEYHHILYVSMIRGK